MNDRKLYVGLDFGNRYALMSYFTEQMEEPDTVSTIAGSEIYQIPIALCKRKGFGQWYYGEDALTLASKQAGSGCDRLFQRALAGEEVLIDNERYTALELLALFVRKLLQAPQKIGRSVPIGRVTVTMDTLSREKMQLIHGLMEKLSIPREQYHVIDHQEAFYYYALNQREELWIHNAVLFDYSRSNMRCFFMERNQNSTPQLIDIREKNYGPLLGNRDTAFSDVIVDAFARRIYSSVYLAGDGFEGDWMKQSLKYLCDGRHVFIGKNLYVKGACYGAMVEGGVLPWQYAYIGENEMKVNISLKVSEGGELSFYSLTSAGENWYEAKGECEILLSGSKEIDFWIQLPDSRQARIESLELTDLPNRPDRMSRLRISTEAVSDRRIRVTIRDLGFGEIYRSSEKTWQYEMGV